MERAATFRPMPYRRKLEFNWEFLAFWVSYLAVIVNAARCLL